MGFEIIYLGTKKWFNDKGQLHREGGPAIEYANGEKHWYINDKCHREDGPAVEYDDGRDAYKEYWYYGQKIKCSTDEEFKRLIKLKAFW